MKARKLNLRSDRQYRQYRQVVVAMVLLCSVFVAGGVAAVSAASGARDKGAKPVPGKGSVAPGKVRPASPYDYTYPDLEADTVNTSTAVTAFTSSYTGGDSPWSFSSTAFNGTGLYAGCLESTSNDCWGVFGVANGIGVRGETDINDGVGVYGGSAGPLGRGVQGEALGEGGRGVLGNASSTGGQGVSGQSDGAQGYGGVFTATGASGVGIQATSFDGFGAYITSTNNSAIYAKSENFRGIEAYSGQYAAVYGLSGNGVTNPDASIVGDSYTGRTTIGVAGYADLGSGVYGETRGGNSPVGGSNPLTAGLYGQNYMYSGGAPVLNAGVVGNCDTCSGVFGLTNSYIGVKGLATGGAGSYGGYFTATVGTALYGYTANGFGVYGYSYSNYGLTGGSHDGFGIRAGSTTNYGLYVTTSTGPAAEYVKTTAGLVGLRAVNTNVTANHYAILADGNVRVNGTLHATGGIVAVSSTDQGNRETYSEQASQRLVTDAGTAKLVNGRAVVKIDPLFAQTVDLAGGYRVFVTPRSVDTLGLGIIDTTPASFTIGELNKGKGNFSFDWKIEAVRKGYEKQRMEVAPTVPDAPTDKQTPGELGPLEPSNTPPPVVPHKPSTTSSGAPVQTPGKPSTAKPGGK